MRLLDTSLTRDISFSRAGTVLRSLLDVEALTMDAVWLGWGWEMQFIE